MSESPFLRFQDKNRDGLPDICKTDGIGAADDKKCPPCVRNPNAVVPDWKKRDTQEPWFNEKYCLMQCTVVTNETSILPPAPSSMAPEDYVDELFDIYEDEAVLSLLDNFGKLSNSDTIKMVKDHIQHTKYDLSARKNKSLRLLYSIPVDKFALVRDLFEEDEEEDTEENGPVSVTYDTKEVFPKLMKLRKAMYMYSRYYRVYTGVEGGNLFFEDSGAVFTHNRFDRYGDPGFFVGKSRMGDVLKELDNWLNDRKYNLYLGNPFGDFKYLFSQNNVTKFTMNFTAEYKLNKLTIYTVGCKEKPIVFGKRKLKALNAKAAYKDATALAYFSKLDEIDSFLSARAPKPWLDFVLQYTYPKVVTQEAFPAPEADDRTVLSCVGDALLEEGKQLGQDIVDDIFSIGDAIAYAFHKNVCKRSLGDINTELEQMGIVYKENKKGKKRIAFNKLKDPKTGESKSIAAMATSQAFEQLEADDQVFVQMCAALLGSTLPLGASTDDIMRQLYRDGLGRLKLCGLLDLMMDAIQCLFKGLTLEEALKSALKSALKALPINNWGQLFAGLPPDKQAELDALVKKRLSEPPKADAQGRDDVENPTDNVGLFGKVTINKPWEDPDILERAAATKSYGNYDNEVRQLSLSDPLAQRNQRTLAQKYDDARNTSLNGESNFGIKPDTIMAAYVIALIEVYSNDLLALVDQLNQFPGAEIIAKIISIFDCPAPPTFDPNFADFLNSIDLPFCRNINEIQLPMLQNPFGWFPAWSDILQKLYEALIKIIQQVLLRILFRILVKICQLIGDAICKALETVGDLAASLPDLITGRDTISNIVKENICGPGASQEQVNATIADMFAKFGVGGAALSNHEKVKQFCEDISNSTTVGECFGAVVGEPSQEFLDTTYEVMVNQHPEFVDALPTKQDLADLFQNVGNLMPAHARASFQDFLDNQPAQHGLPANPSLCATQEDLDAFQDRRCMLLEGRASKEQCDEMFRGLQNDLLEDMDELTNLAQSGIGNAIASAMPPLISTPGCDDGMIPYENEIDNLLTNSLIEGSLQQLQIAYSKDMLGNGGLFAGQDDWGMMNMILADTHARALSTHRRMASNKKRYVDYASLTENEDNKGLLALMADALTVDANMEGVSVPRQEGMFPKYVAKHLYDEMKSLATSITFESDNSESNIRKRKTYYRSFKDAGFTGWPGTLDVNLLSMPDFGYNTKISADMKNERVKIKVAARKHNADIKLDFTDNNDGLQRKNRDQPWGFGFGIKMWISDIISYKAPDTGELTYVNRFDDNARISIVYRTFDRQPSNENPKGGDRKVGDKDYVSSRKYEFLAVDDTLSDIEDLTKYPQYLSTQNNMKTYIPQVYMLSDLTGAALGVCKTEHDKLVQNMIRQIFAEVCAAGKTPSEIPTEPLENALQWQYGAGIDDLTEEDIEYVVDNNQAKSIGGTPYGKAEVNDEDGGTRKINNDDMILGVSYMQWKGDKENRVFYLSPEVYGGSYTRPKMFIKPVANQGWLGMIDVMFPEVGPCKPQYTDLVDFQQISDATSESYNTMPEDQRLKEDPDCVVERPYNRILMRESKASIQSLIVAACRIYASVHYVKSMATFVTFNPSIRENYSSIISCYIVEVMEKDFKDAQGNFAEFFNPFKDEEFWYAFLEQAVQTYARLADEGKVDPPGPVLEAMYRLNDMQEDYKYPGPKRLDAARATRRARKWPFQTLKGWRYEKNLDAVLSTEEDAKLILKEFVAQELVRVAEKFELNAREYGLKPKYNDLALYVLNNFSQGGESLDMDKEIKEEVMDLGSLDGDEKLYTSGGELSLPDGTEYVGYFHKHITEEDGTEIFMVGEAHSDEEHEELVVFANRIIVPIGDIAEFSFHSDVDPSLPHRPFVVSKYISVNGERLGPTAAVEMIKANGGERNISEVYPGTLKVVPDHHTGRPVGLTGQLGVRYGLEFAMIIGGSIKEITSVEMDALDLKCSQMPSIEPDSKLLYCLVNMLKDDEKFKIATSYVFPFSKLTALTSLYNSTGFLPSIGQVTVDKNDVKENDLSVKPGISATINEDTGEILTIDYTEGWEHYKDRQPGFWSWGFRTWDEWDQELLRNSRTVIKRMFKPLYNSRDFEKSVKSLTKLENGGNIYTKNLKASLSFPAGSGFLSWWDKGRLVKTSPFNARGKMCNKNDE